MKLPVEMSQVEMAAYVQTMLAEKGIRVVLSGGAATSFFCENRYVSKDIDLVNVYMISWQMIRDAMLALGFLEEGRYFRHPDSQFFIEFPPGPLTVGMEPVTQVQDIPLATGVLRIISSTDCVKDRLAAYYHWGDRQCLHQAVLVRDASVVDLAEVERWSEKEGKGREYRIFLETEIKPNH